MGRLVSITLILVAGLALTACGTTASRHEARSSGGEVGRVGKAYEINGRWYTPRHEPNYDETGLASWYGGAHQGKPTAMGEPFDMNAPSAAHKTLPLGTRLRVVNRQTGRSVTVRVNDRVPRTAKHPVDLSRGSARALGIADSGVASVALHEVR